MTVRYWLTCLFSHAGRLFMIAELCISFSGGFLKEDLGSVG